MSRYGIVVVSLLCALLLWSVHCEAEETTETRIFPSDGLTNVRFTSNDGVPNEMNQEVTLAPSSYKPQQTESSVNDATGMITKDVTGATNDLSNINTVLPNENKSADDLLETIEDTTTSHVGETRITDAMKTDETSIQEDSTALKPPSFETENGAIDNKKIYIIGDVWINHNQTTLKNECAVKESKRCFHFIDTLCSTIRMALHSENLLHNIRYMCTVKGAFGPRALTLFEIDPNLTEVKQSMLITRKAFKRAVDKSYTLAKPDMAYYGEGTKVYVGALPKTIGKAISEHEAKLSAEKAINLQEEPDTALNAVSADDAINLQAEPDVTLNEEPNKYLNADPVEDANSLQSDLDETLNADFDENLNAGSADNAFDLQAEPDETLNADIKMEASPLLTSGLVLLFQVVFAT